MQSALDITLWTASAWMLGLYLLPMLYGFKPVDVFALAVSALLVAYNLGRAFKILREDKYPANLLARWVCVSVALLVGRSLLF